MTKEELKKRALENIDRNKEEIIAIGDSIFSEPELGFKEFKTAEKVKTLFDKLGITYRDQVALTGVVGELKGKKNRATIAVFGELDAVIAKEHEKACKKTGAAHSCGHNAMIASLAGVAYAFCDAEILKHLSGDIILMAVPAEEYVEIEYRNELKKEGKIHFLGGKQEFIRLGELDHVDIALMQHAGTSENGILACCGGKSNGFLAKLIHYKGKAAHAGAFPHEGINALNAANIGLMAVNAQRETFKEEDRIRVHPIITKGGDLVNVIPSDVSLETYVRGSNLDAILDASKKVDRSFEAGAHAVGAQVDITDLPGYLPSEVSYPLFDVMYENLVQLFGEEKVSYENTFLAASSDIGDVSYLMPAIQAEFNGVSGVFHSSDFQFHDKELSYVDAAKALAMTMIDLLAEDAQLAIAIKNDYQPKMTKEEYLKIWGGLHQ